MKCVICGKNEAYIQLTNFCPSCYIENNPLFPQTASEPFFQIPFCNFCACLKLGRKWYPLEDSFTLEHVKPELYRVLDLQKDVKLLIQPKT
ncbi:MAG: NMD3-related protein, partial [Candidatus Hodarchaeota archaeon]